MTFFIYINTSHNRGLKLKAQPPTADLLEISCVNNLFRVHHIIISCNNIMEQHILHLTSQQLNKFKKGLGFQLSHNQLTANAGKHQVQVHLLPPDLNKLVKNIQAGKGFRFTQKNVKGGSIMSFVKKIIPKDVAKMGLNALADVAGLATTGTPIGLYSPLVFNYVIISAW